MFALGDQISSIIFKGFGLIVCRLRRWLASKITGITPVFELSFSISLVFSDYMFNFCHVFANQLAVVFCLDIQTQEWLGIRSAQV